MEESNTPELAIENTHNAIPTEIEKIEPGVIYDTSLVKTLNIMKKYLFFNIEGRDNGDIIWNGFSVEKMGGNIFKIIENIYDITSGIQKVLTDTSNIPLKKLNDKEKEKFINVLESLGFGIDKAIRSESKSGRYKQSKTNFKKRVIKSDLKGRGVKIIIPSNVIDIYTRLEILLGLNLSGHADSLKEASNLIDELFRGGEIQNEQQYRNALNKFST